MLLMLRGVDYLHSKEKRLFDRQAIHLMQPFAWIAFRTLVQHSGDDTLFLQERVGKDGDLFQMYKLRTFQQDGMTPINDHAAFLRRSGMDELIQYKNIQKGEMSVVGAWRPRTLIEHQQTLDLVPGHIADKFKAIIMPTLPGVVTSFAIDTHLGMIDNDAMEEERIEMGLEYVEEASYIKDWQLFLSAVSKGLTNKMKRGAIRPTETT